MTTTLNSISTKVPVTVNKPEIQLLLCCARTRVNPTIAERIKTLLQQDLDWNYLIQITSQHEMQPLLYQNINTIYPEAVPQKILAYLQSCFQINAQRNLFLTGELLKILNIFKDNNISAIPFKGPILAVSAYENLALRQFCDLDILIDKNNLSKVTKLFIDLGYEPPTELTEADEKPYLKFKQFFESSNQKGVYGFINKNKKICVDLHWTITPKSFPLLFNFQNLWKNAKTVSLGGTNVPQFSPEDLLLYLCVHGSKHCWLSLKWICDVAEFIRTHPDIDWELVEKRASIFRCDRMVSLGLLLVRDLLGMSLPEAVEQKIKRERVAIYLSQQVQEQIFESNFTRLKKYAFLFITREGIKDKVRYLYSLIFTPTAAEWKFLPLPEYLFFLYYLIRPYNLLIKYRRN